MHRKSYTGGHAAAVKRWKQKHPDQWKEQKTLAKERNQFDTETEATNKAKPWTAKEIRYMRRYGSRLTAREIALKLRRTYFAVQYKARVEGISFRSEKKKGVDYFRWRMPPPD